MKKVWSAFAQELIERKVRRISGLWDTEFWYIDETGQRIFESDVVTLKQWGVHITGENEGRTAKRYAMKGKFRNETILTGTWKSTRSEVTNDGAFQLIAAADGREMKGKWLGISKNSRIRNGEWVWTRRS